MDTTLIKHRPYLLLLVFIPITLVGTLLLTTYTPTSYIEQGIHKIELSPRSCICPVCTITEKNITLPCEQPIKIMEKPITSTTLETTTTITCPQPPKNIISPETTKTLLNLPKNIITAKPPAVQHGCYICMQSTWELLQLEGRPKFYAGPSLGGAEDFYTGLGKSYTNITEDGYLLSRVYGYNYGLSEGIMREAGFFLNHSKWMWNNTPQCWQEINTTVSNQTYIRVDTICNISENLFVRPR